MKKNNKKDKSINTKIKIPKTKIQKLKLKHNKLLLIIAILLTIVLGILFISKPKDKIKEKTEIEQPKEEVKESLTVYDINSNKRPYAVMIPNDSGAKKRQYGLQSAYITYEITVEGGITRLLALFKDVDVEKIGPVRSSRHYFLDYAMESDAIYVHFGWSPQAQTDITKYAINNLNGLYNPSNMFWRDKNYSSPNNAFTSTEKIEKAAEKKEYNLNSNNYELLEYSKDIDLSNDETLKTANTVKVNYAGGTYVKYIYDAENKYYLRYNNSKEHVDNLTNKQIHTKNIIILKMDTTNISGDEKGRQNLNNIGDGSGYYITEGKSIEITWSKKSRSSKTIYKNKKGEELKINDGNTFIQIEPTNKSTEIE